jgi:hypothetical protein
VEASRVRIGSTAEFARLSAIETPFEVNSFGHVPPQAFDGNEPREGSQGNQHARPEQDDLGP